MVEPSSEPEAGKSHAGEPGPEPDDTKSERTARSGGDALKAQRRTARRKWDPDTVVGLAVWVAIICGVGLYVYFGLHDAEVFLDVPPTAPLVASGRVLFDGHPVSEGTVQIIVDDARRNRYLISTAATVTNDGTFRAQDLALQPSQVGDENAIRVTARFLGQVNDKEGKVRPVAGTSSVYLNFTPPISARSIWIWIGVAITFMVSLILLFTGELRKRKARLLFSIMYLMTFLSLAVPIAVALLVAQSQYVLDVMEQAPIGLVKAIAPGVSEGQWLINIGGAVDRKRPLPVEQRPVGEAVAASSMPSSSSKPLARPSVASIAGGLTVPFYVVLLAMFGAGINMTRRVPEIQQKYDHGLPPGDARPVIEQALGATGRLLAGGNRDNSATSGPAAAEIRRQLVENYMYLLSAPFLAIAMYYLLQVIATEVAQPVLVVMSFATGLTSDKIVGGIIRFAEARLPAPTTPTGSPDTAIAAPGGVAPEPAAAAEAAAP